MMFVKAILAMLLVALLAGCQTGKAAPDTSPAVVSTISPTATAVATNTVVSTSPLSPEEAQPPQRLALPSLGLTIAVEPMGWRVAEVAGKRDAVWEIPADKAGWHLNSARAGASGNLLLSGYHRQGAAVFAPLARGQLKVGDQLIVTDEAGKSFVYAVREIAAPIPVSGATQEEMAQAQAYLAPSEDARLTIITGWPDFSDTHYLFVVAQYVGLLR